MQSINVNMWVITDIDYKHSMSQWEDTKIIKKKNEFAMKPGYKFT